MLSCSLRFQQTRVRARMGDEPSGGRCHRVGCPGPGAARHFLPGRTKTPVQEKEPQKSGGGSDHIGGWRQRGRGPSHVLCGALGLSGGPSAAARRAEAKSQNAAPAAGQGAVGRGRPSRLSVPTRVRPGGDGAQPPGLHPRRGRDPGAETPRQPCSHKSCLFPPTCYTPGLTALAAEVTRSIKHGWFGLPGPHEGGGRQQPTTKGRGLVGAGKAQSDGDSSGSPRAHAAVRTPRGAAP